LEDKLTQLAAWIDEHVVRPDTPRALILHSFEVKHSEPVSGSFTARLDDLDVAGCRLSTKGNGNVQAGPPLFHSPLGVPATYAAAELTQATSDAIDAALRSLVPPLKALGLDRQTGEMVTMMTPFDARASDPQAYAGAVERLRDPNFSLDATPFLGRS
jgi:hypothetical protein